MNRVIQRALSPVFALVSAAALGGCISADSEPQPAPAEEPTSSGETDSPRPASQRLLASLALAEMIFEGVVVRVEYRDSDPDGPDSHPVPHTFVTYRVDESIKGRADSDELTLRFIGGPLPNGRILLGSGFPLFQVGDHDLLLVRGNGDSACPLVGCDAGRYRFSGDSVYTGAESETLPEFSRVEINGVVLERHRSAFPMNADDGAHAPRPEESGARAQRADELRAQIRAAVREIHTSGQLARLRPVHSVSLHERFTMPREAAVVPRKPPISVPVPRSAADLRELEESERSSQKPAADRK